MTVYPDRVCPVCGLTFTPKSKRQVYDRVNCRVKAHNQRHKVDIEPLDATGLLDEIRRVDAEIAIEIEEIAKAAGIQIAERMLLVCWKALNRGAIRQAKAVLIEAGEVRPVKRRKK